MQAVKGMVVVEGSTYRIVRTARAEYAVVRVLDDVHVGVFRSAPRVEVVSAIVDEELLVKIARMAIQKAKTSWVGRIDLAAVRS
jgi:hypothetical protein